MSNFGEKAFLHDILRTKVNENNHSRAYNAGHVLGAAMFMIEIAGVRVLYTGDFSREEDRHLMSAELPGPSVKPGKLPFSIMGII